MKAGNVAFFPSPAGLKENGAGAGSLALSVGAVGRVKGLLVSIEGAAGKVKAGLGASVLGCSVLASGLTVGGKLNTEVAGAASSFVASVSFFTSPTGTVNILDDGTVIDTVSLSPSSLMRVIIRLWGADVDMGFSKDIRSVFISLSAFSKLRTKIWLRFKAKWYVVVRCIRHPMSVY